MILNNIQSLLLGIFFPRVKKRRQLELLHQTKELCILRYRQSDAFQLSESAVENRSFSRRDTTQLKIWLFTCFEEFIASLKTQCPTLTEEELFLCIYIILQYPRCIVLFLTGISAEALKTRRYRLRKKLSPALHDLLNLNQ
jgi:hypothetical protein